MYSSRRLIIGTVLIAALFVAFGAGTGAWVLKSRMDGKTHLAKEQMFKEQSTRIATEYVLESSTLIVKGMGAFFEHSETVTPEAFNGFARDLLERAPHVKTAFAVGPGDRFYWHAIQHDEAVASAPRDFAEAVLKARPDSDEPRLISIPQEDGKAIVVLAAIDDPEATVVGIELDPVLLTSMLENEMELPKGFLELADSQGIVSASTPELGQAPAHWVETKLSPIAPGWTVRAGLFPERRPGGPGALESLTAAACVLAVGALWLAGKEISRKEHTLESLREELSVISQLFHNSPDLMIQCATDGTIVKTNNTIHELLGAAEEDLVGTNALSLFSQMDAAEVGKFFAEAAGEQTPSPIECYLNGGLAGMVPIRLSAMLILQEGRVTQVGLHMTDLRWKTGEDELAQAYIDRLERNVKSRTRELEDQNRLLDEKLRSMEEFHDAAVGRELRIIELKNKVRQLEVQLTQRSQT